MQMTESTQRLALNLYFQKKRSVAMGFAVTAAGFGPIVVPQLIRFLMREYTAQEVCLIYGGICTNVFVAAALLQPVKWHMKVQAKDREEGNELLSTTNQIATLNDENESLYRKVVNNFVKIFDLDLLKDPIFVNILVGLALATFSRTQLHSFGTVHLARFWPRHWTDCQFSIHTRSGRHDFSILWPLHRQLFHQTVQTDVRLRPHDSDRDQVW
jgi:hypothetical protein